MSRIRRHCIQTYEDEPQQQQQQQQEEEKEEEEEEFEATRSNKKQQEATRSNKKQQEATTVLLSDSLCLELLGEVVEALPLAPAASGMKQFLHWLSPGQ